MIYRLFFMMLLGFGLMGQSNTEAVLEWQETAQLKWSDFKGQPKNLGDVVALTASGISFEFSIQDKNGKAVGFNSTAKAHFYPKRSWVHQKKASTHVLKHEQLHFDITELHLRKFRKAISNLKLSHQIKKELNTTYQNINKDMAVMQKVYDQETNHSKDTVAQVFWQNKIDRALKDYGNYKTTP
ncbi:uncharacterized protein DUF922 [Gelidibacter algens]|uniref:Uncharacterized protein DUF922 n=2 Tax=Gelidibacter algens TaxID=49280 RepID=A0A327RP36_9FLAO|nr:DUF922 domain-containing protein [Gelidibacter algens]RAJ18261.1 uncharacterized protein DUF922 [Gelidibacter algens]